MEELNVGATRKFKTALGNNYIVQLNIPAQRYFNGLPDTDSDIWIPDDNVRKNAEAKVDGYEMVFEVISVGEDCDLVVNESGGVTKVDPIANVGDIVLVKGTVHKVHTEPIMFVCQRQHIVAKLK